MPDKDFPSQGDSSSSTSAPKASTPTPEMSPSFGGDVSDLAKQIAPITNEALAGYKKTAAQRTGIFSELEKLNSQRPADPNITKPEKPPEGHTPPNPVQSWGSLASVLATFGSLATRRPLQNALNASASAMNAIRANDTEAYERSIQEWKMNSEYAEKLNEWELKRYEAAREKYKDDKDMLLAQWSALAAQDQNTTLQAGIRTQGLSLAEQMINDKKNWGIKYAEFRLSAEREADEHTKVMNDPHLLYAKAIKEGNQADAEKYLKAIQAEHVSAQADRWEVVQDPDTGKQYEYNAYTSQSRQLNGQPFPPGEEPKGLAKLQRPPSSGITLAVQKAIQDWPATHNGQQPGADDIKNIYAGVRAAAAAQTGWTPTGKNGQAVTAINTAINHLDTWSKLAEKASHGDVHAANSLWNSISSSIFGNADPTNALLAQQFLGPEVVRAITTNGGGVTERLAMEESLKSGKLSPEQIAGTKSTATEFLAGRLGPLELAYENTFGDGQFDKLLTPQAKKVFGVVKGGEGEGGGSSSPKKYQKGDVIENGGKKYRVLGGDPSDPDIEEIKQ